MKITGQQLRLIIKRETECFEKLADVVLEADSIPLNRAGYKAALTEVNELLAELRVYRSLIGQNTQHTSSLAIKTVAELASDE